MKQLNIYEEMAKKRDGMSKTQKKNLNLFIYSKQIRCRETFL